MGVPKKFGTPFNLQKIIRSVKNMNDGCLFSKETFDNLIRILSDPSILSGTEIDDEGHDWGDEIINDDEDLD